MYLHMLLNNDLDGSKSPNKPFRLLKLIAHHCMLDQLMIGLLVKPLCQWANIKDQEIHISPL